MCSGARPESYTGRQTVAEAGFRDKLGSCTGKQPVAEAGFGDKQRSYMGDQTEARSSSKPRS